MVSLYPHPHCLLLLQLLRLLRSFGFIIAIVVPSLYDRAISHHDNLLLLIHFPETEFISHYSTHTETQLYFLLKEKGGKGAFVARECLFFSSDGGFLMITSVCKLSEFIMWH